MIVNGFTVAYRDMPKAERCAACAQSGPCINDWGVLIPQTIRCSKDQTARDVDDVCDDFACRAALSAPSTDAKVR